MYLHTHILIMHYLPTYLCLYLESWSERGKGVVGWLVHKLCDWKIQENSLKTSFKKDLKLKRIKHDFVSIIKPKCFFIFPKSIKKSFSHLNPFQIKCWQNFKKVFYEDKDMSQWYEKLKCHDVNEREKSSNGSTTEALSKW